MTRWLKLLWVMLLALAGCATPPTPNPDGPRLGGFESLPKSLATVELSPTPGIPEIQATSDSQRPTETPAPPTRTPTATPFLGIFMGNLTPLPGTVAFRPSNQGIPFGPTLAVVVAPNVTPGIMATAIPVAPLGSPNAALSACPVAPDPQFVKASVTPAIRQQVGCPTGPSSALTMVTQSFQNGIMFWRETREIYIFSTAAIQQGRSTTDTIWRFADTWNDSQPASDPQLAPPEGLLQPVRGFGLVWRSNQTIRDAIGWALSGEQPFQSTWQPFERGWMMTGPNGTVYAVALPEGTSAGVHFGALSQ